MDPLLTVEPFGFFTLDALRAGWYVFWRQLVRILPVTVVVGAIGGAFLGSRMVVLGTVIMALGFTAAIIWSAVLLPQLASRWAEARYGYALTGLFGVWWAITWRMAVAALIAAVIFTPPNMVALSLSTVFKGSALGGLGQLLMFLLGLANFVVTILAMGWAMSKVAESQLSGMPAVPLDAPWSPAPTASEPAAVFAHEPVAAHEPVPTGLRVAAEPIAPPPVAPAAAPVAVSAPAAVVAAPAAAVRTGKPQCPKCGLYETERGTVIGWYCTICGWREIRR
jgi:hypothetical protein